MDLDYDNDRVLKLIFPDGQPPGGFYLRPWFKGHFKRNFQSFLQTRQKPTNIFRNCVPCLWLS